jgi:hypothetical protein
MFHDELEFDGEQSPRGNAVEGDERPMLAWENALPCHDVGPTPTGNPWSGPEVELVFDGIEDPFAEYFADAERVVERYVVRGPDDFSDCRHVASREGASLSRQLPVSSDASGDTDAQAKPTTVAPSATVASVAVDGADDADMVVIEEDLWMPPAEADRRVIPVRLGDYRRLFARMRRGGSAE